MPFQLRLLAFPLLCFVLNPTAHAGEHPLWGELTPGKYPVGFRSTWTFDSSRSYNTTFADKSTYAEGKAPRPLLVNLWYPATADGAGERMPHRGYLDLPGGEPRLRKLAEALAEYNREVIAQELLGKPRGELTAEEKRLLEQFLTTPTACRREAAPAPGRFPLVIYHAGYGSSIEDNAVLCEYLASHGYVVLGSAFQEPSGKSFNVDGKLASGRDMAFLITHARQMPNVDWNRIGVIGHSGGAHAALMYRAQENSVVDAVVSLDTTQDYYSLTDVRWKQLIDTVTAGRRQFTGPLLAVANPYAFFPLFDQLDQSNRYYLTLRDLEHNDFIVQGCIAQRLRVQRLTAVRGSKDKPSDEEAKATARLHAMTRSYEALNRYVLRFLDAFLKDDATARTELTAPALTAKLGGAEPHVEQVPPGATGPPPYRDGAAGLPTPRQLRPYLREHGMEQTVALLRRVRQAEPDHPLMDRLFAFALVYELLDQGKKADALAFAVFAREVHPRFDNLFVASAETLGRLGRREYARKCCTMALTLDPGNEKAARLLREFEKLTEK